MNHEDYTKQLKTSVLEQIKDERIGRLAIWRARIVRFLPWVAASVFVVVGGVAFSITLFVFTNQDWRYRPLAPLVSEAFEILPLLWLVVLVGGGALWVWFAHSTEFGYRKRLRVWFGYGALLIVVIGGLAYRLGVGIVIDRYLASRVPFHGGLEVNMMKIWFDPEGGEIVGVVHSFSTSTMLVSDRTGGQWTIDTASLPVATSKPIRPGEQIRVIGYYDQTGNLHACRLLFVAPRNVPKRPLMAPLENQRPGMKIDDECHEVLQSFKNERIPEPVRSN